MLKIIKSENIDVDAMSPGEIYLQKTAGFESTQIFYISNNVSADEMMFAIEEGVLISVDSIEQLELFGKIFGVQKDFIPQVKQIISKYNL